MLFRCLMRRIVLQALGCGLQHLSAMPRRHSVEEGPVVFAQLFVVAAVTFRQGLHIRLSGCRVLPRIGLRTFGRSYSRQHLGRAED
jgi:hypothetical protein